MKNLGFVLIGVMFLGLISSGAIIHFATKDTVTFTVQDRERVTTGDSSRFMIWGETNRGVEVFENTDSLLAFKFNSADVYGQMTQGSVCHATVTGMRIPFLSMNRNILSADCQKPVDS